MRFFTIPCLPAQERAQGGCRGGLLAQTLSSKDDECGWGPGGGDFKGVEGVCEEAMKTVGHGAQAG